MTTQLGTGLCDSCNSRYAGEHWRCDVCTTCPHGGDGYTMCPPCFSTHGTEHEHKWMTERVRTMLNTYRFSDCHYETGDSDTDSDRDNGITDADLVHWRPDHPMRNKALSAFHFLKYGTGDATYLHYFRRNVMAMRRWDEARQIDRDMTFAKVAQVEEHSGTPVLANMRTFTGDPIFVVQRCPVEEEEEDVS
jgi:hypothetical protein